MRTWRDLSGNLPEQVQAVVQAVRDVGPAGVGARDVRECLLLQIERLHLPGGLPALAASIVREHMEDLARGRTAVIAAALKTDAHAVLAARTFIRTHLRPRPVVGPDATPGEYERVRPDLAILERSDGQGTFHVQVLEAERIHVRVDPQLRAAARTDGGEGMAELVRRGDFFVARLRQRWNTLRRIATLVAEREAAFLQLGAAGYQPLTRAAVAAELGLHEATVSRAVAGKYVQLPSMRVMPLAEFFDGSQAVREALRAIIAAEPRPMSDADLGVALRRAGHTVARRTVAKYRLSLGVLPSRAR